MMICSAAKFASGSEVEIGSYDTKYGPASDYIARAANRGYSGAPMSRSAFIGNNCKLGYVGHRLPRLLETGSHRPPMSVVRRVSFRSDRIDQWTALPPLRV
jgi:hypothetical protein